MQKLHGFSLCELRLPPFHALTRPWKADAIGLRSISTTRRVAEE
jgi:hypothetical protein